MLFSRNGVMKILAKFYFFNKIVGFRIAVLQKMSSVRGIFQGFCWSCDSESSLTEAVLLDLYEKVKRAVW